MSGCLLRYHPMDTHVKLFSLIEKHSFLYSLSNLLDIIKISDYEICFLPIPTAVCSKLNREKDCWLRFSWGGVTLFQARSVYYSTCIGFPVGICNIGILDIVNTKGDADSYF